VHLGFVYANAPFATAARMADGAVRFFPLLRRWVGAALDSVAVSDDFVYLVHRDSLLPPDQVLGHARRVAAYLAGLGSRIDYPGGIPAGVVAPLTRAEVAARFDMAWVAGAIRTPERAIAVGDLAAVLRAAVTAEPRIRVRLGVRVTEAAFVDGAIAIGGQAAGERQAATYAHVVNALWDGRLALDARLGLRPAEGWLWRLRYAIFATVTPAPDVPSFTAVLGPFGDVVNLGNGRLYLSWYPTCLVGRSTDVEPPAWCRNPVADAARAIFAQAVAGLGRLAPALAAIRATDVDDLQVRGGIIYAHGRTDIDDPASGLHRRDQVGITSCRGWHSINPGKYTLAPAFACEVAERIRPLDHGPDAR
jgi:hypothetical protein